MDRNDHTVIRGLLALVLMCVAVVATDASVSAAGLKVAPLEYRTNLNKGEKQKGFIDISNPTSEKLLVSTSVQAFKQIDDQGTLQFYNSEQVAAGVLLDLDEFELGPREAVRMYFLLDSTKLPSGDVFASIFFTTKPANTSDGEGQAIRLGTVLSIVNGTPGARNAAITSIDVPFLQFNGEIRGTYAIKNTADPANATGFYPQVRVASSPLGESKEIAGSLVFAGRTRTNEFSLKLPPVGIYRVNATYGNSSMGRWVVVLHPGVIVALITVLLALGIARTLRRRQRSRNFRLK